MNIYEELQKLDEVRKEENLYFQGAFWIKGNSLQDIKNGNFSLIVGSKILTDYFGDIKEKTPSKSSLTHQKLWSSVSDGHSWDYYPRGRVCIDQGTAYIHLNSNCATNDIKDCIYNEYKIDGLRIVLDFNNEYQGSHYDFGIR